MAILTAPGNYNLSVSSTFVNANSPQTLMCWINSSRWNDTGAISMFGAYLSGVTAIQIGKYTVGGYVSVWRWGGTTLVNTAGTFIPPIGQWIHVAYTYNGTTHSLYCNGSLASTSSAPTVSGVLTSLYVNGYPTGAGNESSDTLLDDLRYYNRTLSAAEIQTIYTCAGATDGIVMGLMARYQTDERPSGVPVLDLIDYSGNGRNMTSNDTSVIQYAPSTAVQNIRKWL